MNRFIIVDGLPYLFSNNRAFAVRWDDEGFTVGNEVKLTVIPYPLYSELEIKAKCAVLDSIGNVDHQEEEQPKKATRGRKKASEE